MATDDQVYRLTFQLVGDDQYTYKINQLTANQAQKLSALVASDNQFTNVTVQNVKKRNDALAQGAAAMATAAQVTAAAGSRAAVAAGNTTIFPPATERIVTDLSSRANRSLDSAERSTNSFQAAITKAQKSIATFEDTISKAAPGTEAYDRAVVGLIEAQQKLKTAQDAVAESSGAANENFSGLDQAARNLKDRLDPLGAAYRGFSQSVSLANTLLASGGLSKGEFTDAINLARTDFDEAAIAIRRDAESVSASLVASAERLKSAIGIQEPGTGAISGQPSAAQLAASQTRVGQLGAAVATGTPVSQQAIQDAQRLADENNRLAVEQEAANTAARKLRDSLDPVAAVQRGLSDTMEGYLNLLGLGAIKTDEYTAVQKRAHDVAQSRIADLTGQAALERSLQQFQAAHGPNAALVTTPQVTQANALISNIQTNTAAGMPFDPAMAREAIELASDIERVAKATQDFREQLDPTIPIAARLNDELSLIGKSGLDTAQKTELVAQAYEKFRTSVANLPDARNQREMADQAQRLRDQIDPLGAAFRTYGETVAEADKFVASGNLTIADQDKVVRLAQATFANTTASIRQNAESMYAALKTASDKFQTAQTSGGFVGPPIPTTQITTAENLAASVKTNNIATGEPISPATTQAIHDTVDELTRMTAAEQQAADAAQKLKDELDPIAAVQRNLNEQLSEYDRLLASSSGRVSQSQVDQAKANATNTANIKIADLSGLTAAQDEYDRLSKGADAYKAKLNPLITAQKLYGDTIAKVNEYVSVNALSQKEADAVLGNSVQKYNNITAALAKVDAEQLNTQQINKQFKPLLQQTSKDFADFSASATHSFGLNRVGFLELQASGINAFQSLAAGISPLRTAETEGAQVVGALIQGTNLTLKQFVSYAAPIAGVTAAFVAFGVAIAGAAAKSTEIRQLNVALATFHQGADTTSQDLQKLEKEFARSGESTTVLKTAVAELARNPNINISATGNILDTARNIGAAFGTDLAGGLKELTTALDGGAQGIVNLGVKLGVLSADQVGEILILDRTVGRQAAVKKGYEDITAVLKPYTDSLGPAERLGRAVTGVWNEFIDSIKESEPVQNALKYLQELTDKLTNLKGQLKTDKQAGPTDKPSLAADVLRGIGFGAAEGAATGTVLGGIAGAPGVVAIPVGAAVGAGVGTVVGGSVGGLYGAAAHYGYVPGGLGTEIQAMPAPLDIPGAPSVTAPTIGGLQGVAGQDTAAILKARDDEEKATVALGSSLRTTNDNVIKFSTDISTLTSATEKDIREGAGNQELYVKNMELADTALQRLTTAFDTASTNISNVKIPTTIGGMQVGGGGTAIAPVTTSLSGLGFGPVTTATSMIESGGRNIPQQIVDSNTARGTPGFGVLQITTPTWQQFAPPDVLSRYSTALQAPLAVQLGVGQNIPLGRFGSPTQDKLMSQFGQLDKSKTLGQLDAQISGLGLNINTSAAAGPSVANTEALIKATGEKNAELQKSVDVEKQLVPILSEHGSTEQALTAGLNKKVEVLDATHNADLAQKASDEANIEVIDKKTAELDKANEDQIKANNLNIETGKSYLTGSVPGIQAQIQAEATLANIAEPLTDKIVTMNTESQKGADASAKASAEQVAATTPLIARQQALADAAIKGTQAEHEQSLVNQAQAANYDNLNKAIASYNIAQTSGTDADKQRAQAALDLANAEGTVEEKQIRLADIATQKTQVGNELQQNRDQAEILALQVSLQGQTTEEIQKQTALMQVRQQIQEKFNNVSEETKQKLVDSVAKVQDFNIALASVQRQQERINQLFLGIGQTISSSIGTAIEDAFSGTKITDWGTRLKQIIGQVISQITQFALIQPALGSALQAIGLAQAAQGVGTFSSLTGGGYVPNGSGGFIPNSAASGLGSVGSSVGGLGAGAAAAAGGSIFGTGGFTNFLNNLGEKLGFAAPGSPFSSNVQGPSVPGASTVAEGAAQGSLFGTATLGQFLGASGIGAVAGILANTLRGGNTLTGTGGSVLGSLGGAALGSILFPGIGTFIGGALGGTGGGLLGGLFGNDTKSNVASGVDINTLSGVLSGAKSGGNQQNDQTVSQIASSVSAFTQSVQQLTKGTAPAGTLNVQAGTRDGIVLNFAGDIGKFTAKAQDAATAINNIELQIAQHLTGVSDTLKTVLAKTTDPSQIQVNVAFAASYDDLKTAADSAFGSISTDVKTVGPFAQALDTLNATFAGLTAQANQFGLSLDPINKGLAEATKRLRDDFGVALDQAINSSSSSDYVNQLTAVAQDFASNTREAIAIGLGQDSTTTGKITQLEQLQAGQILGQLNETQLNDVITKIGQTNPELAAMAKAILDAGLAAKTGTNALQDTATALNNLATAIKSIEDLVTNLKTGQLSGLPPAQATTAAIAAFQSQYGAVQSAGNAVTPQQLTDLTNLATQAITESQNAYGEGPQTATFRNQALADLNNVLGVTGSSAAATKAANAASGATATTPAVASVLAGSAAVQATQAAAAATASSGTIPITAPSATTTPTQTAAPATVAAQSIATVAAATPVAASGPPSANQALWDFGNGNASPADTTVINQLAAANGTDTGSLLNQAMSGAFGPWPPPGAASGSMNTPPGPILVGERGPEWMLPVSGQWTQVGRNGPEIINQPGGAIILPNPMMPQGRAFADGTDNQSIGFGEIAGQAPGIGSAISQAAGGGSLLDTIGGAAGISDDVLSSLGDILPIAGPILGGLLGLATGGNVASAGFGAATSIAGFLVGGPIGGVIGGLLGLLGKGFGPKPSNLASGDLVDLSSGAISDFQSAGDKKADQTVQEISAGISSIATTFQKATSGTVSGMINVQDGRRDGIKTSYTGPLGHIDEKWGNAKDTVGKFALAIAHNLEGINPSLQATLAGINDPNALIPAIEQATNKSIDLFTGSVTDNVTAAAQSATATPSISTGTTPATAIAATDVFSTYHDNESGLYQLIDQTTGQAIGDFGTIQDAIAAEPTTATNAVATKAVTTNATTATPPTVDIDAAAKELAIANSRGGGYADGVISERHIVTNMSIPMALSANYHDSKYETGVVNEGHISTNTSMPIIAAAADGMTNIHHVTSSMIGDTRSYDSGISNVSHISHGNISPNISSMSDSTVNRTYASGVSNTLHNASMSDISSMTSNSNSNRTYANGVYNITHNDNKLSDGNRMYAASISNMSHENSSVNVGDSLYGSNYSQTTNDRHFSNGVYNTDHSVRKQPAIINSKPDATLSMTNSAIDNKTYADGVSNISHKSVASNISNTLSNVSSHNMRQFADGTYSTNHNVNENTDTFSFNRMYADGVYNTTLSDSHVSSTISHSNSHDKRQFANGLYDIRHESSFANNNSNIDTRKYENGISNTSHGNMSYNSRVMSYGDVRQFANGVYAIRSNANENNYSSHNLSTIVDSDTTTTKMYADGTYNTAHISDVSRNISSMSNSYSDSSARNFASGVHRHSISKIDNVPRSHTGTPPGKILVGEKGPEWMYQDGMSVSSSTTSHVNNISSIENHPSFSNARMVSNTKGWTLVGKYGQEVIDQKGGATILPFPRTPWEAAGRAFAGGTGDLPETTFVAPRAPSTAPDDSVPMGRGYQGLLEKLDSLNKEVVALRRVTQGGQADSSEKATVSNRHLGDINRKIATPLVAPQRQKLA